VLCAGGDGGHLQPLQRLYGDGLVRIRKAAVPQLPRAVQAPAEGTGVGERHRVVPAACHRAHRLQNRTFNPFGTQNRIFGPPHATERTDCSNGVESRKL
jgi:hypothetical protein